MILFHILNLFASFFDLRRHGQSQFRNAGSFAAHTACPQKRSSYPSASLRGISIASTSGSTIACLVQFLVGSRHASGSVATTNATGPPRISRILRSSRSEERRVGKEGRS